MKTLENSYIKHIKAHEGIFHKIVGLYTNTSDEKHDLTQEIMLQGWKSFPSFSNKSSFGTWLYKLCLNTALTFRKKENKHLKKISGIEEEPLAERKEDYEILYYLVKKLNESR